MKRLILTTIAVCLSCLAFAQPVSRPADSRRDRPNRPIEEFLTDLTATQKTRIDVITKRSGKTIEFYRKQLKDVRDSIRVLMDDTRDRTAEIFPLFEREGFLKSEISKEYYRTKVAIDEILTPEQYARLREQMKARRLKKKQ